MCQPCSERYKSRLMTHMNYASFFLHFLLIALARSIQGEWPNDFDTWPLLSMAARQRRRDRQTKRERKRETALVLWLTDFFRAFLQFGVTVGGLEIFTASNSFCDLKFPLPVGCFFCLEANNSRTTAAGWTSNFFDLRNFSSYTQLPSAAKVIFLRINFVCICTLLKSDNSAWPCTVCPAVVPSGFPKYIYQTDNWWITKCQKLWMKHTLLTL